MNCFDLLDDHVVGELFARMTFDEAWDLSLTCRRFLPRNPAPTVLAWKSISRTVPFDSVRLTALVAKRREREHDGEREGRGIKYDATYALLLAVRGHKLGFPGAWCGDWFGFMSCVLRVFLTVHGYTDDRKIRDYFPRIEGREKVSELYALAQLVCDDIPSFDTYGGPSADCVLAAIALRDRDLMRDLNRDPDSWDTFEDFARKLVSIRDPGAAEFFFSCADCDDFELTQTRLFAIEHFLGRVDYGELLRGCTAGWDLFDANPDDFAGLAEPRGNPRFAPGQCRFVRVDEQCERLHATDSEFCNEHVGLVTVEIWLNEDPEYDTDSVRIGFPCASPRASPRGVQMSLDPCKQYCINVDDVPTVTEGNAEYGIIVLPGLVFDT